MKTAVQTKLNFLITGDSDGDGILNHFDQCPHSSQETYNKFQDEDGCPDYVADNKLTYDSDGDGIVDNQDLCPTQPETFNGIDDKDGCPDDAYTMRDSDRDGIPDVSDACPLEPETYNFYQDTDGCPDFTDSMQCTHLTSSQTLTVMELMTDGMHALMNQKTIMIILMTDGCPDVTRNIKICIT